MQLYISLNNRFIYLLLLYTTISLNFMNKDNQTKLECSENKKANSLINETSPYLLDHAYNPVNWYAWNTTSLNQAKREDKPIFLSIGYSSCHWCHVMEKKSFENEEIATILNENFISIKVDREERPDLDKIYMDFVQHLNGNGGWPLNVFLTPDLKPFFGGTYFPPDNFKSILLQISTKWNSDFRTQLINYADNYSTSIQNEIIIKDKDKNILNTEIFELAEQKIKQDFDEENGGFGNAPKFPSVSTLEFLLRRYYRTQNKNLLNFVLFSLRAMSKRGIFDTVGGGFHRYSVDKKWKVPHFEKMLYDNAALTNLLLEAFKLSKDNFLKDTALKTLEFIEDTMTSSDGAFFSAIDADDKNGEGMFYLWKHKEIIDLLGTETGELISLIYNIIPLGNMPKTENEHKEMNIFYMEKSLEEIAKLKSINLSTLQKKVDDALIVLKKTRAKRATPSIDDKIITSWNALMISAFANAYKVTSNDKYLNSANKACDFILDNLYQNNFLYRSFRKKRSKNKAYLDDYAFMIEALINLYEASLDFNRIIIAKSLADKMIELFWDKNNGGFYYSQKNNDIISIKKEFFDSSVPSGNSSAVKSLIKLSQIFDHEEYKNKAKKTILNIAPYISRYPLSFSNMLLATDLYTYPIKEIVISRKKEINKIKDFRKILYSNYLPNSILLLYDSRIKKPYQNLPIFKGRESDNTLLFICENNICKNPVSTREELLKLLNL